MEKCVKFADYISYAEIRGTGIACTSPRSQGFLDLSARTQTIVKTDLLKTKRIGFLNHVARVGTAVLITFITSLPAWAQSESVVKLYACPREHASVTTDNLIKEYGLAGVRVAYDEPHSQLIVEAPPEVQARISQRLAAAFPNQQPAPPGQRQTRSRFARSR